MPIRRAFALFISTVALWCAAVASPALAAGRPAGAPAARALVTGAVTTTLVTAAATAEGLIVEPDDGVAPIYALLRSPEHRLDLVMYELIDPTAEAILAADAARGVVVRVILDQNRERQANTSAYRLLRAHGVQVAWAAASFEATHEKALVIDPGYPDATAAIMTLNLTARYYADTRDVAVLDRDPTDIAAIESAFSADLAAARGRAPAVTTAPDGADLVWSPGALPALVELIASATTTLAVENEELSDQAIVDALAAAARRGVRVTVVMTDQSDYTDEFADLRASGVSVGLYPDRSPYLYIHAKVTVADGRRAFVGSENFSAASLERNREAGLVTTAPAVVTRLASMIAADASRAPEQ
jgi:cardiolipin synthase A/B